MTTLEVELHSLPAALRGELAKNRFDQARLVSLAGRLANVNDDENRMRGDLAPPAEGDVVPLPERDGAKGHELEARGVSLLAGGGAALVVLAGGMATRMGGVVKALVETVPGKTFLALRLAERRSLEERVGHEIPLWLMTSSATDAMIREALGAELDGSRTATFLQSESLRLTKDGHLFRDATGNPSAHAPGHGDLVDALRASGLLDRFLDKGGKTVSVANLDNLGGTLDPLVLGFHLSHGLPVTCEVVDKLPTDRGGIPVRHGGRTLVLEEFRIPKSFDPSIVRVFATNTFHFDARVLAQAELPWTYFVVQKKVGGQTAIQFERLINEVTSHLDTRYLKVPRTGKESRFLPVKDNDELRARRDEIEVVARARGMLR